MSWIKALPPPSWFRHPIKRFKDSARFLFGRKSDTNFIRLWPNPGFMFTIGRTEIKWSVFRGYSRKTK